MIYISKDIKIPNNQLCREAAEAKAAVDQSEALSTLPSEPASDCGQVLANIR